jgi:NHS family xanthosine MFS transporter
MFYISGFASLILDLFFYITRMSQKVVKMSWTENWDWMLLSYFTYKMALFFIFSMFLGGALQLTNMYGDTFISEFAKFRNTTLIKQYKTVFLPKFHSINDVLKN